MNRIGQYVRHWLVWLRSGVGKRVDIGWLCLATTILGSMR